ncbi:LysR family transcriptional regulator [Pseudomonas sp. A2]|uniref:LysR family transcriptional regulator n=1 Tax=Pseudomonas sp. A2 TaxID=107445 RepID=UPI002BA9C95E|nr:LysR family transcriptional regulator [Pseudomonas sp. A2]MEB3438076.1 LysR family transcriptional regulator [Pseudomonas sp. A2]
MHLDLTDLKLFVLITEAPSLTKGARKMFMSPAAASVRIKGMEARLGATLFYRDSRGVELTEAGRRLLVHARIILRQVGYVQSEFAAYAEAASGHIRIFANSTAVTEFLPEILARYLADNPGVTVDLQERLSRDIVRGVLEGATDMGIIAGPVSATGIEVIKFSTDRLVVIVPKAHELADRGEVKLTHILGYQHVGLHAGSTLSSFLRERAEELGSQLSWRIQLASFEAVCRMVEAGVGISVVPESAALRHSRTMALSVVPLTEPWAVRERSILVRELDALPGCIKKLIAAIRPLAEVEGEGNQRLS